MSLQQLIENGNVEIILIERRFEEIPSIEERAGKILAALYTIKDKTNSIEPLLFLSVPNSMQHIINILHNIDPFKGELSLKAAIELEMKIILQTNSSESAQIKSIVEKTIVSKFRRDRDDNGDEEYEDERIVERISNGSYQRKY